MQAIEDTMRDLGINSGALAMSDVAGCPQRPADRFIVRAFSERVNQLGLEDPTTFVMNVLAGARDLQASEGAPK